MLKQPIGAILKMQVCKQVDLERDAASSLLSQECQTSERLKKNDAFNCPFEFSYGCSSTCDTLSVPVVLVH